MCESILEDAHDRTIRAVAWSPGDTRLATASFDGTCVVWSCKDGEYEQIATLQGHENEVCAVKGLSSRVVHGRNGLGVQVKSVAWDASGNLLATCSRDKSVWVWENVDGEDDYECVAVLHGHSQVRMSDTLSLALHAQAQGARWRRKLACPLLEPSRRAYGEPTGCQDGRVAPLQGRAGVGFIRRHSAHMGGGRGRLVAGADPRLARQHRLVVCF